MEQTGLCPQCWRREVLQSRPQSLGELVASWVRVVPFSCRSCGYRFLEWVGMRGMAGFLPDRRRHLRVPVRLSLSFSGGKVRGKGTVIDISLGGCKIQSDVPVTVDDIYYLEILVSEQEQPFRFWLRGQGERMEQGLIAKRTAGTSLSSNREGKSKTMLNQTVG